MTSRASSAAKQVAPKNGSGGFRNALRTLPARAVRTLLLTRHGRLIGAASAAAIVAGLYFDETARILGWTVVPFSLWVAAAACLVTYRPAIAGARWREILASLLLSFAAAGALGMVEAASPATGPSMGGRIGEWVARTPTEWDTAGATIGQYALSALRTSVFVIAAAAVVSPAISWRFTRLLVLELWRAALAGAALLAALGRRFTAYTARRMEARRLQSEDRAAWEAYQERHAAIEEAERAADPGIEAEPEPAQTVEMLADDLAPAVSSSANGAKAHGPRAGAIAEIESNDDAARHSWDLPPLARLRSAPMDGVSDEEITATSRLIEDSLRQYGIAVTVDQVRQGPTVTMYGLKPGWKGNVEDPSAGLRVRVDTILNREKDLALALASPSLRFEAPVPGESVVGIEVPNKNPAHVTLRSAMETPDWKKFEKSAQLPVPLGIGSGGDAIFADFAKMPHTLVAGATGSGKSVCMNSIITGLLMCRTPAEVRMVMIDPKRVELTPYQGVPHLYTPVVVEASRAVVILKALIREMMERFQRLESAGVKNIAAYNEKASHRMPYLAILIDELADVMLTSANEVERLLVRLAQLGRATGVHLIVATQRPSVDVVTGLIKANFPSRISFAVMSQIDSRTILDSPGAEKLLGRGDMLYMPIDRAKPLRVQGAFLSDSEIEEVVAHWKNQPAPDLPQLDVSFEEEPDQADFDPDSGGDSLFEKAASLARTQKTLSTSLLQRRMRIGYPRAARLMDELEDAGIVGPGEPGKPRRVI